MSEPQMYRKRPIKIEAMQWISDLPEQRAFDIVTWAADCHDGCSISYDAATAGASGPNGEDWGLLEIETLEGTMTAAPYGWIIRGINGEFYPCKPDIFDATYEAVTDDE